MKLKKIKNKNMHRKFIYYLACICFSGCKLLGCLKATKSPKIASQGAVRVPSRAVRLFPALLALMRTALIRGFSQ